MSFSLVQLNHVTHKTQQTWFFSRKAHIAFFPAFKSPGLTPKAHVQSAYKRPVVSFPAVELLPTGYTTHHAAHYCRLSSLTFARPVGGLSSVFRAVYFHWLHEPLTDKLQHSQGSPSINHTIVLRRSIVHPLTTCMRSPFQLFFSSVAKDRFDDHCEMMGLMGFALNWLEWFRTEFNLCSNRVRVSMKVSQSSMPFTEFFM